MNIRKIIDKYEKFEQSIFFVIFLISGIITIVLTSIMIDLFNKEGFVYLFLYPIFPFIVFGFLFILGAFIFTKIKSKYSNNIVKYVGDGFYEINSNYYSTIWQIKKEIETNDIIELNKTIDIDETYYLISNKKTIEITKEQYNELSKVASLKNKPILMLTEEEYNNFVHLGNFISFELV